MREYVVGTTDEVPPGEGIGRTIDGLEIAIFNVDGQFYAIQNSCQHKGGLMYEGEVDEESCSVYCPWHWWEWDLESGRSPVDPDKQMRTFETEVINNEIRVLI